MVRALKFRASRYGTGFGEITARLLLERERVHDVESLPYPETDADLWLLVRDTWGIEIPYRRICEEHVPPFEAFADAFYAREEIAIWEGSRGFSGKTNLLAVLCATEEATLGVEDALLGGSLEQAGIAHSFTQDLWAVPTAPRHLLIGDTTKRTIYLRNGGQQRVLAASTRSVRGRHPVRLRLDEIDEMTLTVLDAAMGQPMPKVAIGDDSPGRGWRPLRFADLDPVVVTDLGLGDLAGEAMLWEIPEQTTLASTHHYPDGTMTEMKRRAADRGWRVYRWCYRETVLRAA